MIHLAPDTVPGIPKARGCTWIALKTWRREGRHCAIGSWIASPAYPLAEPCWNPGLLFYFTPQVSCIFWIPRLLTLSSGPSHWLLTCYGISVLWQTRNKALGRTSGFPPTPTHVGGYVFKNSTKPGARFHVETAVMSPGDGRQWWKAGEPWKERDAGHTWLPAQCGLGPTQKDICCCRVTSSSSDIFLVEPSLVSTGRVWKGFDISWNTN